MFKCATTYWKRLKEETESQVKKVNIESYKYMFYIQNTPQSEERVYRYIRSNVSEF